MGSISNSLAPSTPYNIETWPSYLWRHVKLKLKPVTLAFICGVFSYLYVLQRSDRFSALTVYCIKSSEFCEHYRDEALGVTISSRGDSVCTINDNLCVPRLDESLYIFTNTFLSQNSVNMHRDLFPLSIHIATGSFICLILSLLFEMNIEFDEDPEVPSIQVGGRKSGHQGMGLIAWIFNILLIAFLIISYATYCEVFRETCYSTSDPNICADLSDKKLEVLSTNLYSGLFVTDYQICLIIFIVCLFISMILNFCARISAYFAPIVQVQSHAQSKVIYSGKKCFKLIRYVDPNGQQKIKLSAMSWRDQPISFKIASSIMKLTGRKSNSSILPDCTPNFSIEDCSICLESVTPSSNVNGIRLFRSTESAKVYDNSINSSPRVNSSITLEQLEADGRLGMGRLYYRISAFSSKRVAATCDAKKDKQSLLQSTDPVTLPCGHTFHYSCLVNWFSTDSNVDISCPNCRD
jgi:hypothetical protein